MYKKVVFLGLFILLTLGGRTLTAKTHSLTRKTSQEVLLAVTPPHNADISEGIITVTRIIDGDTLVVKINGTEEKVRLIGVDTPETVDPRKPVQCFGKEASDFMKNLLEGKQVRLEPDSSQDNRDKYNRLLRYVFLSDSTLVNKVLIAEGYGHEYTYHLPYLYQKDFKTAEHTARTREKGLWSPTACP